MKKRTIYLSLTLALSTFILFSACQDTRVSPVFPEPADVKFDFSLINSREEPRETDSIKVYLTVKRNSLTNLNSTLVFDSTFSLLIKDMPSLQIISKSFHIDDVSKETFYSCAGVSLPDHVSYVQCGYWGKPENIVKYSLYTK